MHTSTTKALFHILLAGTLAWPAFAQTPVPTPKFAFAEPSLSPDGSEIAFVSGGDIWTVPANGGEARLLVSHPDNESRPLYSPDGKYLAFVSSRTGNGDVYLLTLETGAIKRLTYDDGAEVLTAWSRDGKMVYFQSTSRDIAGMNDMYRVPVTGGTPMAITADRYANEFYGAPSPDGKTLAFSARGIASNQWWRKGHSHLDEAEIWLYHSDAKKAGTAYERLTESGAKELWPMWSQDGKTLFYVSDRNQGQNLWTLPIDGKPAMLTNFTSGRVLWPSISYDGKAIVFERDFQLWKYDIASRQATPIAIRLRGVAASPAVEHLKLTNQFRELTLSPDGKKVAFVAHGDVFAASTKEGGDATRISHSAANESQPVWTPNSRSLVYVSTRDGVAHLYRYDFSTRDETRLTDGTLDDGSPVFSPDGKSLAFVRNGQELRVVDLTTKKDRLLKKAYLGRPPFGANGSVVWSPDGKWIAFASYGAKTFRNISVIPAAGGESKPISFLANTFGGNVSWSPDGKYILFGTTQRTETAQIARVDLVPRSPKFREDQFRDLFNEEVPKTLKPAPTSPAIAKTPTRDTTALALGDTAKSGRGGATRIVFDDIRQRLSLLPVGVDVDAHSISKDGKTLLLVATVAGQQNLYTYSLDELGRDQSVARQLTSTPGSKSGVQFSPDGKEVFYLEQGRVQSIALDKREPKPLAITAEMDVDFGEEKIQVFRQAWDIQNKGFYDSTFHGVDWKAVRAEYESVAAGARTPDELRRLISLMLGELNASHSGISAPAGSVQTTTGRIGLRFDREEYENKGRLKITEVIALGPAAVAGSIKPGDYLLAVDDTKITASTNLDQLLENQINRRLALTIASSADGTPREVTVRPVNLTTEKGLLYKQWVQQQRQYVDKVSGGRLGYVHMYDMSAESLAQLSVDLDADNHAREGVVVDVRNNNGGFVNAYALDVFTRKGYMTMTSRGLPSAPARTQLGQRALETPTILITNQHSLSDAEDFTEGYRTLKVGKVVGEPTAGWIIYTSAAQLIDGSNLRLPFSKITDNAGKNMELAPRPVDIAVARPIGESYTDKNSQLDAAVAELLKELNEAKAAKLSIGK
ncbi:DPP IV N-terminal domain-containing protein [Spirosoma sp. RP8]|uniref:Tricorn protease homolog n=1 Tax=Spirosoma liriopis TaxID=2937440 RepID=A0ABT0HJ67_9BACT|nr:S41 family peptidase [Spirosoma liriopis]MCK8492197.1 DPP IV N-terminal domain-containing protein [Spirosoma liriopis]